MEKFVHRHQLILFDTRLADLRDEISLMIAMLAEKEPAEACKSPVRVGLSRLHYRPPHRAAAISAPTESAQIADRPRLL